MGIHIELSRKEVNPSLGTYTWKQIPWTDRFNKHVNILNNNINRGLERLGVGLDFTKDTLFLSIRIEDYKNKIIDFQCRLYKDLWEIGTAEHITKLIVSHLKDEYKGWQINLRSWKNAAESKKDGWCDAGIIRELALNFTIVDGISEFGSDKYELKRDPVEISKVRKYLEKNEFGQNFNEGFINLRLQIPKASA